jgi:hypothetical protein
MELRVLDNQGVLRFSGEWDDISFTELTVSITVNFYYANGIVRITAKNTVKSTYTTATTPKWMNNGELDR